MSVTEGVSLEERVALLQAELDKQIAARKPWEVTKWLKKIVKGVFAAFASTEAVKQEKSLAALVIVRIAISVGATAGTVGLVQSILSAAGWVQ